MRNRIIGGNSSIIASGLLASQPYFPPCSHGRGKGRTSKLIWHISSLIGEEFEAILLNEHYLAHTNTEEIRLACVTTTAYVFSSGHKSHRFIRGRTNSISLSYTQYSTMGDLTNIRKNKSLDPMLLRPRSDSERFFFA